MKTKQQSDINTALINGKIITVDKNFSIAQAVAFSGEQIIYVGNNEDALNLAGPSAEIINLNGAAVIPGIIDSHLHCDLAASSRYADDIPDFHTIAELLDWVRLEAQRKKKNDWIIHPIFFHTRLKEMRRPTLAELDEASHEHPVLLNGGYGGMVNSAALQKSNIPDDIENQGFLRDKISGELNGIILNSPLKYFKDIEEPNLTRQQRLSALEQMLRRYNQTGITSIGIGMGSPALLDDYRELKKQGRLTVRITHNMTVPQNGKKPIELLKKTINSWNIKTGDGDNWVKTGALKLFLDGGILTGTAWMRRPWSEKAAQVFSIASDGYRGVLNINESELAALFSMAIELDWGMSVHVTGDCGLDVFFDAAEKINENTAVNDKRFSIIHGNFLNSRTIERVKKHGVRLEMQPSWLYNDADAMRYILGDKKMLDFHPYNSLLKAGIVVSGGSDHMYKFDSKTSVNPYNPFLSMWTMVTRKTKKGSLITPDEVISREDCLRMYTVNNASAVLKEKFTGTIEAGKLADLVVLSDDILECPADRLKDITSKITMVGGKIVHTDGSLINKEYLQSGADKVPVF